MPSTKPWVTIRPTRQPYKLAHMQKRQRQTRTHTYQYALSLRPLGSKVGMLTKGKQQCFLQICNKTGDSTHWHPSPQQWTTSLQHLGPALNTLVMPQTNTEWLEAKRKARRGVEHYPIPASGYQRPWLARTYLITKMRRSGVMRQ